MPTKKKTATRSRARKPSGRKAAELAQEDKIKRRARFRDLLISRRTAMESISHKYLNILEDPDDVLSRAGLSLATAFDEIQTDGHLSAVMGSRRAAVHSLEWDIVRNKASAQVHKHVLEQFDPDRVDIIDLVNQILEKNPWGFSPIETKWMADGSRWWISEFVGRPSRWFKFDDENRLRFISMKEPVNGEEIPEYKILLARNNPTYDNPYGEKLFSKSYWPITFKRNGFKWWNIYIEKFAIPSLIGKYPPATSETDAEEFHDMLDDLVADNVSTFPNTLEIDTLEAKGKTASADIFEQLCKYMDAEVSKVWLGETLTTEIGPTGSYAASKTHEGVKNERRDADKHEIERIINQAIEWVVKLNFGDVPSPKFVMSDPLVVTKEQAEIDAILSRELGVKFNEDYIAEEYGKNKDHFVIVEKQEPDPLPGQDPNALPQAKDMPFALAEARDQAALEKAFSLISDAKLGAQAAQAMKPIIDIIEKSETYSDALDAVLAAHKDMSLSKAETALRRAYFVSQVWGRANA